MPAHPDETAAARLGPPGRLPATFRPQLATLTQEAPPGDDWLHEVKYDGYRIGCRIEGGRVTLLSRNGNDWTARFPEVAEAARALPVRAALIDGELAVLLPDGRTSFQALQNAQGGGDPRRGLAYFAFDLLHLDGHDTSRLVLEERKALLQGLIETQGPRGLLRGSEHLIGRGPEVLAKACELGLEGIISKRRDRPYAPGRTRGWQKTKCILRQEFAIGGFTEPEGAREGLGALLVGYFEEGRLVFAGKVGTGFTQASAKALRTRLDALERGAAPFQPAPSVPGLRAGKVHWVEPRLVGEVAFTEWTSDGKIRHPSFQGLREDKAAGEVRRERPGPGTEDPGPIAGRESKKRRPGRSR